MCGGVGRLGADPLWLTRCRSVPNKKHMAAATALFGTSFLGLLKYFFGTWIPSFQQLISNRVRPEPLNRHCMHGGLRTALSGLLGSQIACRHAYIGGPTLDTRPGLHARAGRLPCTMMHGGLSG